MSVPEPLPPSTSLSDQFGQGASAYDEASLKAWHAQWRAAAVEAKARQWSKAIVLLEGCICTRPDFAKGYVPLSRAHLRLGRRDEAVAVLRSGLAACATQGDSPQLLAELRSIEGSASAGPSSAQDGDVEAAVGRAAAAAEDVPVAPPPVRRESSNLGAVAERSLLAAGFSREGWAWLHGPTGTRVLESADGGVPEVYHDGLAQADIDGFVELTFALAAWGDGFGQRLVRWVEDALVQDGAAEAAAEGEGEGEGDDERQVDVGLSRLPTAEALGATPGRQLTIYTWGDKVVSQTNLERETGCVCHFNAKPLNGRGGGANLKYNATQDARIVRNVVSSMADGEGREWLRRVVRAIEAGDERRVSVFCSQGRHRSVSAALVLQNRYFPAAEFVPIKMR